VITNGCPHCGSDRPAVEDPGYRFACPACGGPRLPPGTFVADGDKSRQSTNALVRAKAKGDRGRWGRRLIAISATLLTLSATLSLLGGHLSFISILAMGLMWASFAISYRRRHMIRANRVKSDLDEAYALAGASQLRVMVEASPADAVQKKGVRVDEEDEAHKAALAEAEAEAEKEDAFADFDRRLAEAEKKKQEP
jgi:hypothetical protein